MEDRQLVTPDPWRRLRSQVEARIALGRAGGSLPTAAWLDFKMAHAAARDAVHEVLDSETLSCELAKLGLEPLVVSTAAATRESFLRRPDWGSQLDDASRQQLKELGIPPGSHDLALIVSDGLSARAVHNHAVPLLQALLPRLALDSWTLVPPVIASLGRVALQDEIGDLLQARIALILIGERPGLAAPDSLGAYLVHEPKKGNSDSNRNCVSNIRAGGLSYDSAADTLQFLLNEARRRGISGVELKDSRSVIDSETTKKQGTDRPAFKINRVSDEED